MNKKGETIEPTTETDTAQDAAIVCMIDNARVHSVQQYIKEKYPDTWTIEQYKEQFPGAPLLSQTAIKRLENIRKKDALKSRQETQINFVTMMATNAENSLVAPPLIKKQGNFHEVFGLGKAEAARGGNGDPIKITVFEGHSGAALDYLPLAQDGYVYDIDLLKKVIVGFELNLPIYLWGFHGTGKTTMLQEAAAHTGRPFIRVQHTMNMQESDVLGQWTVRDGSTIFQPGPLTVAMVNGWVYCADEYDFAMPAVAAVYQPVLEGQNLIIKDAPPNLRRIVPHPDFRFVATGNTNGAGDETGLYSGTQIMNAANFSRFGLTQEVKYMAAANETQVLVSRAGIDESNAKRLVRIANDIRKAFADGTISTTISPRELITAAKLGVVFYFDWKAGLELAFTNRMTRIDKEAINQLIDRVLGS